MAKLPKPKIIDPAGNELKARNDGDAGIDLTYTDTRPKILKPHSIELLSTTAYLQADPATPAVGLVCSRSSLAIKGLIVANAPGIIDMGYTGEIRVALANITNRVMTVTPGDRIAQIIITPIIPPSTDGGTRGSGGFGSTGV